MHNFVLSATRRLIALLALVATVLMGTTPASADVWCYKGTINNDQFALAGNNLANLIRTDPTGKVFIKTYTFRTNTHYTGTEVVSREALSEMMLSVADQATKARAVRVYTDWSGYIISVGVVKATHCVEVTD